MKNRRMLAALNFVLFSALLITPAASPQMPARPGRLHLTSIPTNQRILINKTVRTEQTDTTLIVSPGTYTVQIGGCVEQSIAVASGVTVEVHCP
jgi:hypothetical protein